jgi:hypothetical protein
MPALQLVMHARTRLMVHCAHSCLWLFVSEFVPLSVCGSTSDTIQSCF